MIAIEECARKYFREEYRIELPSDFHGIDYQWTEKYNNLSKDTLFEIIKKFI
jgi:hypothetical protein